MRDRHGGRRPDRSFELVGPAEILDQLPRCIRFTCIAVVREPAPVRRRELPSVAIAEVREDRARPTIEAAVLVLENRDLIRAGHALQLMAILGPWFDLACDEVDPELCQDLAHCGRERAPLGLVQRDRHCIPAYGAPDMYLKPLSTASVTTTASGPSCSASRRAPTTFAPAETPAKMPSSRERRAVISIASSSPIAQTSSTSARSNSGGTKPAQPCIANAPFVSPVMAADDAGSRPTM